MFSVYFVSIHAHCWPFGIIVYNPHFSFLVKILYASLKPPRRRLLSKLVNFGFLNLTSDSSNTELICLSSLLLFIEIFRRTQYLSSRKVTRIGRNTQFAVLYMTCRKDQKLPHYLFCCSLSCQAQTYATLAYCIGFQSTVVFTPKSFHSLFRVF